MCGLSLVVGDRWKSLPRDPKKGVGGVREGQSPKTSQRLERQSLIESSRPGQPKAVGRVKASGTQSTWPVQCDRTSEGFG